MSTLLSLEILFLCSALKSMEKKNNLNRDDDVDFNILRNPVFVLSLEKYRKTSQTTR
jgi:hypothetical protein